ncbi:hypothetical protein [Duganella vulcania]|uniref:Uncharacterized protein n=1 Tax=Duganella vulcania TaxID=2692166 RepID=A0A845GDG2_9BURK|nr:hypothetical protein [Duganella vulcania]MYM92663.1 hypothetical protein [Duganella vulcania]
MTSVPKGRIRAPGAGVKADDGAKPLMRKQINIDAETFALLTAVGGDQLSLGVREAARRLAEHADLAPFDPKRHRARSALRP